MANTDDEGAEGEKVVNSIRRSTKNKIRINKIKRATKDTKKWGGKDIKEGIYKK